MGSFCCCSDENRDRKAAVDLDDIADDVRLISTEITDGNNLSTSIALYDKCERPEVEQKYSVEDIIRI